MSRRRRAGTASTRARFEAAAMAVALSGVAWVATACAATQEVRAVRPTPAVSLPTAPTAPTTTLASAVPTTVPTPVVPVAGWSRPATTLPPAGGFTGASCISDVFCLAVGGGANEADASLSTGPGVVSSWDGATWTPAATYFPAPATGPATAPEVPAIACTDGPRCAVVDGSGHTTLGDGTTWSPPAPLAAPVATPVPAADPADPGPGHAGARSAAVTCPTSQFCAYVDNTGHVAVLQGTTWSIPQVMTARVGASTMELYQSGRVGIACADAATCTAVVGDTELDWNGSAWSSAPGPWPAGASGDSAVSCPAARTCLAVRGSTASVRTPWSGWSTPRVIDGAGGLDGISCPTTASCMAIDAYGNVVHLTGGTWSTPTKVVPTPVEYSGDGTTVSCPTDQFCMAMNGDGDYATFQGAGSAPGAGPATSVQPTFPTTTTAPVPGPTG